MPDAMTNGGFAPYLAQAFTPQGVPGGLFGGGVGNVPGNFLGNPTFGQNYGAVPPFAGIPQLGQQFFQPNTNWQQQMPQSQLGNPFGQLGWQGGAGPGWPYGQAQQGQYWPQAQYSPQTQFGQSPLGWQEPLVLAHLMRQYAVPVGCAIASPHGQHLLAHNIAQTADMLTRVLPLVGAPQLIPLAQLLGQYAQPISAAIASSPYGQAHIAQNIVRTAEVLERVLPSIVTQQFGQPFGQPQTGWQQQVPQFPGTGLFGQQYQPQQSGQHGQGQFGSFPTQSGDLARILPFLAQQQGWAGQGYGMART